MDENHARIILDYERGYQAIRSKRIRDPDIILPGDHVKWKNFGLWRHGIVVEVHTNGSVPEVTFIR